MENKKNVVVVGAGFGGFEAVKLLAKCKDLNIIWIDKSNHHLFQPLLYQVATAVLSPADIAIPARTLTSNLPNVTVIMGEVTDIDKVNKRISYDQTALSYDYLILAMGARTGYFGNNHWKKYTVGLKSILDALQIRNRILLAFEKAETHPNQADQLLNFIIIGGGPTGVEMAGSIGELARQIVNKDFRYIRPELTKITLIEAGPRLLPAFTPELSEYTKLQLEKRGVNVMTHTKVTNIDEKGVHLQNAILESSLIIWAAGVEANPFGEKLGVPLDRGKRVVVNPFCSLDAHPEIFVIGDMASFLDAQGKPLPGVSPVAMQQGRHVARIIRDEIKGKPRQIFTYFDKGSMATIGRATGIAQMGKFKLKGLLGWLAWLFIHLFYLVGFKNRISTFITWVWSYLTLGASARVIHEPMRVQLKEDVPPVVEAPPSTSPATPMPPPLSTHDSSTPSAVGRT
jgi:NADH dehydrogenase